MPVSHALRRQLTSRRGSVAREKGGHQGDSYRGGDAAGGRLQPRAASAIRADAKTRPRCEPVDPGECSAARGGSLLALTSPPARRGGTQPLVMYRFTHMPPGRRQAQVAPDRMSECSASFGGDEAHRPSEQIRTMQPGCERASRGSRHDTSQLYTSPSPRSSSGPRVCQVSRRGQVLSRRRLAARG
jgi:hypothetical protein